MATNQPDPFLRAEWRYLAMLNYEIDPAVLVSLVPKGTEIDSWEGRTYVSTVGFLFLNTRVLGIPIPFHRDFEEVNLRFYVRWKSEEGWRRGVVFVKEIVPRWFIAKTARVLYNENYAALPMRHQVDGHRDDSGFLVSYGWTHLGRQNSIEIETNSAFETMRVGSEEQFIAEHYWGYSRQRDGGTLGYRVEHPPWRVARASKAHLDCDVAGLYGEALAEFLSGPPSSAFLAEGSEVTVYRGVRLK